MKNEIRTAWRFPFFCAFLVACAFACSAASAQTGSSAGRGDRVFLTSGWMLQSSCEVHATGEQISKPGFSTTGWHEASVPSTVVAALVADKTYPDPYVSDNLRHIPG